MSHPDRDADDIHPRFFPLLEQFEASLRRGEKPDSTEWVIKYDGELAEVRNTLESLRHAHEMRSCLTAESTGPESDTTPEICGFQIIEVLGEGGMGVVYKARQVSLDRFVAIKMLRRSAVTRDGLALFRKEAETASSLKHEGIVSPYDFGDVAGTPFFTMPWVEGPNLFQYMKEKPLSPVESARLILAVTDAIGFAHSQGFIHRDIKPSNILMADQRPMVTDFGIAKRIGEESIVARSIDVVGTLLYMAPEQLRDGVSTTQSDVYGIGAVLYHLLVGNPPHTIRPRDLSSICTKCIESDPEKRYASATHLADDLRNFLNGRPVFARHIGPLGRCARWSKRNPSLVLRRSCIWVSRLMYGLDIGLECDKSRPNSAFVVHCRYSVKTRAAKAARVAGGAGRVAIPRFFPHQSG